MPTAAGDASPFPREAAANALARSWREMLACARRCRHPHRRCSSPRAPPLVGSRRPRSPTSPPVRHQPTKSPHLCRARAVGRLSRGRRLPARLAPVRKLRPPPPLYLPSLPRTTARARAPRVPVWHAAARDRARRARRGVDSRALCSHAAGTKHVQTPRRGARKMTARARGKAVGYAPASQHKQQRGRCATGATLRASAPAERAESREGPHMPGSEAVAFSSALPGKRRTQEC